MAASTLATGRQGSQQEKEYAFAIRVAEEAEIPVHIFHLKIIEESNWGTIEKFLSQVESARARGLEVSANQYPYTAMSHGWSAFFPVWARRAARRSLAECLRTPRPATESRKIRSSCCCRKSTADGRYRHGARISPANQKYAGMRVRDIAKARGEQIQPTPDGPDGRRRRADCRRVPQSVGEGSPGRNEAAVDFRRKRWHCLDLDAPGAPHPRNYGTHARALGGHARELNVLTLEDGVRKMTSLPAQILGLRDRGLIRKDDVADIVVFDKATAGENEFIPEAQGVCDGYSVRAGERRPGDRQRTAYRRETGELCSVPEQRARASDSSRRSAQCCRCCEI